MTELTIAADDVAIVQSWVQFTLPTNEAGIDAGQYVRMDTNGKWVYGNGSSSSEVGNIKGIATATPNYTGAAITAVMHGILDLGDALDSMNIGAPIYVDDTDGKLTDTSGESTTTTLAGYVIASRANTGATPDKLAYIDLLPKA